MQTGRKSTKRNIWLGVLVTINITLGWNVDKVEWDYKTAIVITRVNNVFLKCVSRLR